MCFNSTLVQLKDQHHNVDMPFAQQFQFYLSSIKRFFYFLVEFYCSVFQFYLSSIKREKPSLA